MLSGNRLASLPHALSLCTKLELVRLGANNLAAVPRCVRPSFPPRVLVTLCAGASAAASGLALLQRQSCHHRRRRARALHDPRAVRVAPAAVASATGRRCLWRDPPRHSAFGRRPARSGGEGFQERLGDVRRAPAERSGSVDTGRHAPEYYSSAVQRCRRTRRRTSAAHARRRPHVRSTRSAALHALMHARRVRAQFLRAVIFCNIWSVCVA
jgi:hypothetical protein